MNKNFKHKEDRIINALFIGLFLIASIVIFKTELSENYVRSSQEFMISEIFDTDTDAVLTDAYLLDLNNNFLSRENADRRIKSTNKYIISTTNTKITTSYKLNCRTHLNLKPIIYTSSKIFLSTYHPYKEYPSIS